MVGNWWKNNSIAALILTVIRIYLGYAFFTAGLGKVSGGQFDASGFIGNAVKNPVVGPDGNAVFSAYSTFLENIALPYVGVINILVPWGELLVGLGLMLGCLTSAAAFFGMVMNFSFLMAGTVSHSPSDIIMEFLILVGGLNAGKIGVDRYLIPFLQKMMNKKGTKIPQYQNLVVEEKGIK